MEDQSADSGDLTTTTQQESATASVPQGKAGRSRHRLPRQKARQGGEAETGDELEAQPEPDVEEPDVAEPEVAPDVEVADEATVEEPTAEEPVAEEPTAEEPTAEEPVAEAPARRRMPWRRAKAPVVPVAAEETETDADEADTATETDTAATEPESVEPEPEPILVPHRPAGRLLKVVAVVAGVLFVAAGAFAGSVLQPYLVERAAVQEKFEIAETAASAITTLWTYTPDDMDTLAERSARFLSNDFANEYRNYIDGIAATNKQAQVTNNTQVLGAAVESYSPNEATALVYTNSVATSPLTKGIPSLRYFSYRLSMTRDGSQWKVTQMVAVTKLDLTPRL